MLPLFTFKNLLFAALATTIILSCSKPHQVSIHTSPAERGDAVFSLIVPDNNYATLPDIHIYSWTQNGELNVCRSVIDFDLTSIPQGAMVKEAFLNLKFNNTSAYDKVVPGEGNQGKDSITIQRITSDWNEQTVTWRTQPRTTIVNQTIIPNSNQCCTNYSINVTRMVSDMINDPGNSFGFMIRYKNEVPYNVTFFASKDHPDKNLHPTLTVHYQINSMENKIEISGIAHNRKGGAIVESNGIHYWIEGKDSWEEKFVNKEVIVKGDLQNRNDNPVFVDTSEIKIQGIPVVSDEEKRNQESRLWILNANVKLK